MSQVLEAAHRSSYRYSLLTIQEVGSDDSGSGSEERTRIEHS